MSRLLAITIALSLGAQALATGGAVKVCRFTGRVMEGCPCPHTDGQPRAEIKDRGCCEIRAASRPASPAVVSTPASRTERLELALLPAVWAGDEVPLLEGQFLPPRGRDPPPRERLFVSLRHLLI
jgi:hypothetical protein